MIPELENNELCSECSPGCATIDSGNVRDGGAKASCVHRGFFGVGDLPQVTVD
jgi:hypothetical protein